MHDVIEKFRYEDAYKDIFGENFDYYALKNTFVIEKVVEYNHLADYLCFAEMFFGFSDYYHNDRKYVSANNICKLIDSSKKNNCLYFEESTFFCGFWIFFPKVTFSILSNDKIVVTIEEDGHSRSFNFSNAIRFCRLVGDLNFKVIDWDTKEIVSTKYFEGNGTLSWKDIRKNNKFWGEICCSLIGYTGHICSDDYPLDEFVHGWVKNYISKGIKFKNKNGILYIRKFYLLMCYIIMKVCNVIQKNNFDYNPYVFLHDLEKHSAEYKKINESLYGEDGVYFYHFDKKDYKFLKRAERLIPLNIDRNKNYHDMYVIKDNNVPPSPLSL